MHDCTYPPTAFTDAIQTWNEQRIFAVLEPAILVRAVEEGDKRARISSVPAW